MSMSSNTPNILLITTDQQRFDTCGAAAPSWMRTPHIDLLERDGITFTHAYADCPVCVPGRASIMTGRSVFSHGMGLNAPTCEYFGTEDTLPTLLRARGYQTVGIGKLHFHPQRIRHGFDETVTLDQYYREMSRNGNPLQPRRHGLGENEFYATMATVPEPLTLTSWITEQAVEFLTHRRDPTTPFFLWVSYSKPHPPLDPPEPYYSMYRGVDTGAPWVGEWAADKTCPGAISNARLAHGVDKVDPLLVHEARAAYHGLITHIDYNLGRLLAAIQDKGPFDAYDANDNTLIAFASDHGELLGDHHLIGKGSFHEGSAHVPMVLRMPRTWDNRCQGTTVDTAVTLHDILPTLVGAAGGPVPETVEGQDLVALARGELEAPRRYVVGGAGFSHQRPDRAQWVGITDGRWKYMWYYDGGAEQLFDLAEDPHELRNLADDTAYDARRGELRTEVEACLWAHGGRLLENGSLYSRPYTPVPDAIGQTRAFPGLMVDMHPSDCLH